MKAPGSIIRMSAGLLLAADAGLGSVSAGENSWWQASNAHIQMNDPNVTEGVPAVFTIRVPEKLPLAVRWQYRTEDASATAGSDYTAVQGILQFDIGEREKQITVPT